MAIGFRDACNGDVEDLTNDCPSDLAARQWRTGLEIAGPPPHLSFFPSDFGVSSRGGTAMGGVTASIGFFAGAGAGGGGTISPPGSCWTPGAGAGVPSGAGAGGGVALVMSWARSLISASTPDFGSS